MDFTAIRNLLPFILKDKYHSEEEILQFLIHVIYNGDPRCPICNSRIVPRNNTPKKYRCVNTFKNEKCKTSSFSVITLDIFRKSSTPLIKWIYAIHKVFNENDKISAVQLMLDIDVTYKTAWRMLKLTRAEKSNMHNRSILEQLVESESVRLYLKRRFGIINEFFETTNTRL